jgi:integrase
VKTSAQSKREAKRIEMAVMTACRSSDFRSLDSSAREVCIRLFQNQGWEIPPDLFSGETEPKAELTLWRAIRTFLTYPEIKGCSERERYEQCFVHLVDYFGKDKALKSFWIPDIKKYMAERLNLGVSPSTVNREKGTLSKMFQVLVELRLLDGNPCRMVKNLSQKSEERQVYLAQADMERILERLPLWARRIVQTAFYTGMRRGEILGLKRKQVDISQRMIYLGPQETKEGHWKRVPIHRDLAHILENIMKVQSLGHEEIFLVCGKPPYPTSVSKQWRQAVLELSLQPRPRFHDLRHTWKTNARRSGMDPEIRESIMGHWYRGRNVNERYGRIGDEELIRAMDQMTFDHGKTEILVARG